MIPARAMLGRELLVFMILPPSKALEAPVIVTSHTFRKEVAKGAR
jgi:hypothetical protein